MLNFILSSLFAKKTKIGVIFFTKYWGILTLCVLISVLMLLVGFICDYLKTTYNLHPAVSILLTTFDYSTVFFAIIYLFRPILTFIFHDEPLYRVLFMMRSDFKDKTRVPFISNITASIFRYYFFLFAIRIGLLPFVKNFRDLRKLNEEQKQLLTQRMNALFSLIDSTESLRFKPIMDFFDLRFTEQEIKLLQSIK
ncbi:hypothetical protein A7M79_00290 [Acinetobacter baumannii]|uniref:hypothetical protein n=1 Tax=Acinetobacter baumannii TaxID=470 RepID=UPI0008DD44B4|nr:hypothetical protein [Acinetobacter baumannii]OIH11962.1 hypothetical protein A7M79_00290 [Acinetobacter baumannii]